MKRMLDRIGLGGAVESCGFRWIWTQNSHRANNALSFLYDSLDKLGGKRSIIAVSAWFLAAVSAFATRRDAARASWPTDCI